MDALPSAYMPPRGIAELWEKVRRRAFLVRERTKLRVKFRSILTYEGVKPPGNRGLFTERGASWLHGLGLESVESARADKPDGGSGGIHLKFYSIRI